MSLRRGHGKRAGSTRVEVLPPDELPPASPSLAVRPERGGDGRFAPGNQIGRSRRVRPGPFAGVALDEPCDLFRPFAAWGRRYASKRRAELAAAHGGSISTGVAMLVESESLALSMGHYARAKAAQTGDVETMRRSSALLVEARQHGLAAWELAAREGLVMRARVDVLAEWMARTEPARREGGDNASVHTPSGACTNDDDG